MKSRARPAAKLNPRAAKVLSAAVVRAAELLGVTSRELGAILGLSEPTVSRLVAGRRLIDPASKEGEIAARFLRFYRSAYGLWETHENVRAWLRSPNSHLNGVPAELIKRLDGLVYATDYLDAYRARV